MEQSLPIAISRETRSPEIQPFTWASVKQFKPCTSNLLSPPNSFCCAPAAGRGRPISQYICLKICLSSRFMSIVLWPGTGTSHPAGPASRYSAASWGIRSTGTISGSPWQEPRPERGAAGAQGELGAAGTERKLPFRAPLPRRALRRVAQSL